MASPPEVMRQRLLRERAAREPTPETSPETSPEPTPTTDPFAASGYGNGPDPVAEPTPEKAPDPEPTPVQDEALPEEHLSYDTNFKGPTGSRPLGALEDDVLTGLCTNAEACPLLIKGGLKVRSFTTKPYQDLARFAIEHWNKYQVPITVNGLRNAYEHREHTDEGKFALFIIEAIEKIAPDISAKVLLAQLDKHVARIEIDRIIGEMHEDLGNPYHDVARALTTARQFALVERKLHTAKTVPTAEELRTTVFPPLEWVVKDMIPEGVTLICGPPKLGKSFLTLAIAISVAPDGAFSVLGSGPSRTGAGVLYLGLEDNGRRLQDRIKTLIKDRYDLSRLHYQFRKDVPQLGDGLIGHIEAILDKYPYIKLVTIDTLQLAVGDDGKDAAYKRDVNTISQFSALAQERNISIILVHHPNKGKGDSITKVSGTQGIAGTVDTIAMLTRMGEDKEEKSMARLQVNGRDLIEYPDKLVELDKTTARWRIIDDWDEANTKEKREGFRMRILNAIRENDGPISVRNLAHRLGKSDGNVASYLTQMKAAGLVENGVRGLWDVKGPVGDGKDEKSVGDEE
jgi:hypothetical protein